MKKISFLLLLMSPVAFASDFFDQAQIDGDIRWYDFNTTYDKPGNPSTNAISLGGALNILSGPFFSDDFKLGASIYTAQPLGLNSDNHEHIFKGLPGFPVTSLGQSFLQYQHQNLLVRAGNQLINTPWLNAADSYIMPATYQGLYSTYSPWQDITLTALRTFRFKSRIEDGFSATNLYNSDNLSSSAIHAYGNTQDQGALAFGGKISKNQFDSQLWYYEFYNIANLVYGDSKYTFNKVQIVKPYLGAQALREWGDGKNALTPYMGSSPNTNGVGLLTGLQINQADISLGYDHLLKNNATTTSGSLVSPYTAGYRSDPLYTTSMLTGLVETGPGEAFKVSAKYTTLNQRWIFASSYAKYFTSPTFANINETDLDGTYQLGGKFKGLSLRDRLGISSGNKTQGRTVNNRVMVQYSF